MALVLPLAWLLPMAWLPLSALMGLGSPRILSASL